MSKGVTFGDLVYCYSVYDEILRIERFIYQRPDNQKFITEQIDFDLINNKIISCDVFSHSNYTDYLKVEKITIENIDKITNSNFNKFLHKKIEEKIKEKENIEDSKKIIYENINKLKNDIKKLTNIENKTENQKKEIKRLEKAVKRKYKMIIRLTADIDKIEETIKECRKLIEQEEQKINIIKEYILNRKE